MSETRSRHVKNPNNSDSLNSSARKPSVLCLTVEKVQLLEILHSPESRLSDEMQTGRPCKRSYEALRVLHREHISRESSVYARGIPVKPFRFQRKAVNYEQTLNSYHSYHSAEELSNFIGYSKRLLPIRRFSLVLSL